MACVSGLHAPRDGTGVLLQHWNHRTRSLAYLQLFTVALLSFAVRSVRGVGVGAGDGTGMRSGLGQEWPGVAKLLIRFHFLPFPPIPTVDGGDGAGYEDPPSHGWRASENHGSNQLGYGVRGSCRWFGGTMLKAGLTGYAPCGFLAASVSLRQR